MKKFVLLITIIIFVFSSLSIVFAFDEAREILKSRGISESDIAKAEMPIIDNPKVKALESVGNYCDEIETKNNIAKEINQVKKIKGKSGYPDYARLRHLDAQYNIVSNDIKEQQRVYKYTFGKNLNSSSCKNRKYYEGEVEKLQNKLLMDSFKK